VNKLLCLMLLVVAIPGYSAVSLYSDLPKNKVSQMVVDEALRTGVQPELVLAVARVESNFATRALSHAGARGVMQIMPNTALGEFGVEAHRLYDPATNIRIGTQYLKQLLHQYDGREDLALSHYNGGSAVRRADGTFRVIPATRDYVNRVLAHKARYKNHPQVLAAKADANEFERTTFKRSARIEALDDFGAYGRVAMHRQRIPYQVQQHQIVMPQVLDQSRSQLVKALRELKFKNTQRAQYWDDF
jgi:hypothetical protein